MWPGPSLPNSFLCTQRFLYEKLGVFAFFPRLLRSLLSYQWWKACWNSRVVHTCNLAVFFQLLTSFICSNRTGFFSGIFITHIWHYTSAIPFMTLLVSSHLWGYSEFLFALLWGWENFTGVQTKQISLHKWPIPWIHYKPCPTGPLGGPVLLCSVTPFGHLIRSHRVTSSLRQAFSTAFHLSLLRVEWFFCCQTALWILDLEWAVTFCNWKFITQRQFHWAWSLFNTWSLG